MTTEAGASVSERLEEAVPLALRAEEESQGGGKEPEPRNAGRFSKWTLPPSLQKKLSPTNASISAQGGPVWTPRLQNCKGTKRALLRPRGSWRFVTATTANLDRHPGTVKKVTTCAEGTDFCEDRLFPVQIKSLGFVRVQTLCNKPLTS